MTELNMSIHRHWCACPHTILICCVMMNHANEHRMPFVVDDEDVVSTITHASTSATFYLLNVHHVHIVMLFEMRSVYVRYGLNELCVRGT